MTRGGGSSKIEGNTVGLGRIWEGLSEEVVFQLRPQ